MILSVEVDDRWARKNAMSSLQDRSDLARYSHMSATVPDPRSQEFDSVCVLAQLTYCPSIIVNPWTGNASLLGQVLAEKQLRRLGPGNVWTQVLSHRG